MRRLTLRLGEAQAGRTVHTLLRQELLLSAASVRRAKTLPDGILLDGLPVFTNQSGRAGQLLSVAVGDVAGSEQIPPVPGPLTIRYEDEDLVVVEKEGG
ncbi:MAG: RluA family pseudouridine synthase, partial [Evtepia gabavorous]